MIHHKKHLVKVYSTMMMIVLVVKEKSQVTARLATRTIAKEDYNWCTPVRPQLQNKDLNHYTVIIFTVKHKRTTDRDYKSLTSGFHLNAMI